MVICSNSRHKQRHQYNPFLSVSKTRVSQSPNQNQRTFRILLHRNKKHQSLIILLISNCLQVARKKCKDQREL